MDKGTEDNGQFIEFLGILDVIRIMRTHTIVCVKITLILKCFLKSLL